MPLRRSDCHHLESTSHYRSGVPSHSKQSRNPLGNLSRNQLIAIAGALVVVIGGVIGAVVATSGGGKPAAKPPKRPSTTVTLPGTTQPTLAANRCPLTDLPAPGGTPPRRAPIAVKIGNEAGPDAGGLGAARPQSGLDEADIVYDTPAEGGIMRYIAIYQCNNASQIGPVRSIRWVDSHILAEFRDVILAHVGGIQPNLAALNALRWVGNADDDCVDEPVCSSQDFQQLSSRVPPDATYTSTQALWSTFKLARFRRLPSPVFRYSAALPSTATPVAKVSIDFSSGTDSVWEWSPTDHAFLHYFDTTPDVDQLNQQQVSTSNVFIQVVNYRIGPYEETAGISGSGDVESQTVGTGRGWILRNGEKLAVTWHRAALPDPTTLTDAAGKPVGLAPGRTWVEMVIESTATQPGAISFTG